MGPFTISISGSGEYQKQAHDGGNKNSGDDDANELPKAK